VFGNTNLTFFFTIFYQYKNVSSDSILNKLGMMTDIQGYYKCFSATDKNVSLYLTIFRPKCLW
jgi:hypothetical protein